MRARDCNGFRARHNWKAINRRIERVVRMMVVCAAFGLVGCVLIFDRVLGIIMGVPPAFAFHAIATQRVVRAVDRV